MARYLFLLLAGCISASFGGSLFHDPCRLEPNPGPTVGSTMTIQADKACSQGTVWWSYPQGNLRVEFQRQNPSAVFQICLLANSAMLVDRVIDVQSGRAVPKPESTESCVYSEKGRVILEFQSDSLRYYGAYIKYEVRET